MPGKRDPSWESEDDRFLRKAGPHKKKNKPEPVPCDNCGGYGAVPQIGPELKTFVLCERCKGTGEEEEA